MRWFFGGMLGAVLLAASGPASATIEQDILVELNLARTQPAQYAAKLREFRALFQGNRYRKPGANMVMITQEGVAAVDEAIAFLERQPPLQPFAANPLIAAAAADHVADIGPKGLTQHDGSDGAKPWDRMKRRGFANWRSVGEGIAFGPDTGESVVVGLIVDDGVPNRGHRKSIFTPEFRLVGVACGPHKTYRITCVIDYADPK